MSSTSETLAPPPAEKVNGLATYFKIIYAPTEAFATLARVPMWGWAALIGVLLTLAATIMGIPAIMHLVAVGQERALSQLPADQAAAQKEVMAKIPQAVYVVFAVIQAILIPWFLWLVATVVFLIGGALGGGEARFKMAWTAAVNSYIIGAIGAVATYAIIAFRGPDAVSTAADLYVLPSLAMLVHGSAKLAAFLYSYNILYIWYYVVAVIALEQMLKLSRGAAITTVAVWSLVGAGLAALGAAFQK